MPPAIFFYYSILSNSRFKTLQQNLIENFNKHLKRTTHHKEQFPTEDSLDRFLVSQFNVYNEKSLKRIHRGFKGLQDPLEASFI
ncbi:transposase [Pediococcus acidilactici]|uniref:transposase n=1 Tax=Pediococcus acidilactici TaxID=1254 RepID=UPI0022A7AE27|nr:transposase [Pediococcus acidilactici]